MITTNNENNEIIHVRREDSSAHSYNPTIRYNIPVKKCKLKRVRSDNSISFKFSIEV